MADKINLYEEMNEKIADILAIEKDPSSLYASAYIKDLRAENARLKAESVDKERAYNEKYNLQKDLQREWADKEEQIRKGILQNVLCFLWGWNNGSLDRVIDAFKEKYGVEIEE